MDARVTVEFHPPETRPGRYIVRLDGHLIGMTEDPAVAALISSAPDLLAACEACLALLKGHTITCDGDGLGHVNLPLTGLHDAIRLLSGAIEKSKAIPS